MDYDFELNVDTSFYPDLSMEVYCEDLTKLCCVRDKVNSIVKELSKFFPAIYYSTPYIENDNVAMVFDFQSNEYDISFLKKIVEEFQKNKELKKLIKKINIG